MKIESISLRDPKMQETALLPLGFFIQIMFKILQANRLLSTTIDLILKLICVTLNERIFFSELKGERTKIELM